MALGFVYVIQAGDLYKIGRTRNLLFRLRSIGMELKMSVRLLHIWTTRQPQALEALLHAMMAPVRIAGEWFRLGPVELERLRRVNLQARPLPAMPRHPPSDKPVHPLRQRRPMSVALMTDHPLKRWREHETITQAELARRCGVKTNTVARWERGEQIPRGVYLARLLEVTGLSAEAIVLPEHFLQRHPDFLRPAKPPGRPRKRPPPEGGPDA